MKNSLTRCVCVNTKIGNIAVPGGVKPVLILELATDGGEILIKYFNVSQTEKDNYTVPRNSDFARLYRLTTGQNPSARFSRADRLLSHFFGYEFNAEYVPALDKKNNQYLKVTAIRPCAPVDSDAWTITGHLRKSVSSKNKKLEKNWQPIGKILAKTWQFSGNCNSTGSQIPQRLEDDFNPIQHPPSKVKPFKVPTDSRSTYTEEDHDPPPFEDFDLDSYDEFFKTLH